jgi:hypothetical protein
MADNRTAVSTPADTTTEELLSEGWQALARTEWERGRSLFEAAAERDESAEALEGLSLAAWWLDDAETMFATRERAYRQYRRDGDVLSAGRLATLFGIDYFSFRGEAAIGNGWFRRAHRLLDELPPVPRAADGVRNSPRAHVVGRRSTARRLPRFAQQLHCWPG